MFVALINYFVTFKVLGKNYEAAVMSAGMCGIAIGSTQTL
ncbi:sodium/glutamate symporter [Anaerococcus sp.]